MAIVTMQNIILNHSFTCVILPDKQGVRVPNPCFTNLSIKSPQYREILVKKRWFIGFRTYVTKEELNV